MLHKALLAPQQDSQLCLASHLCACSLALSSKRLRFAANYHSFAELLSQGFYTARKIVLLKVDAQVFGRWLLHTPDQYIPGIDFLAQRFHKQVKLV